MADAKISALPDGGDVQATDEVPVNRAGTTVKVTIPDAQPADATLDTYAGIDPSANVQSVLGAADYAAIRTLLGLVIGTNVQAFDSDLSTWAGLTPSAFFQTLVDDADAATARATLGVIASLFQNGGAQEISVAGLSGELADPQPTDAAHVDSGAATDGQILTADGAGGAAWEDAPAGGAVAAKHFPIQLLNPRVSSLAGNSFFTVLGLTDWDVGHWEFVKDVDGKIYGVVRVPPSYVSGGVIRLAVAANATSGATRLGVGVKAVADGESLNPTLTDETKQDITVPGTAYLRKDVTFTLTETLAADDLLLVEVFHEGSHANDTLAVNTLLLGAWLEVTA